MMGLVSALIEDKTLHEEGNLLGRFVWEDVSKGKSLTACITTKPPT